MLPLRGATMGATTIQATTLGDKKELAGEPGFPVRRGTHRKLLILLEKQEPDTLV